VLKIGIARGIPKQHLIPAFQAALEGGFSFLEITMNTEGAAELIYAAAREFSGKAQIGAGTVTDLDEAKEALGAGAQFIVSPLVNTELIDYCKSREIPVFPGALTPTEIYEAWKAGATMVKVFPVKCMGGAEYIKELRGPFDKMKLLACGGVTPQNLPDYVKAGIDGIGIGGQLFRKDWIESQKYENIRETALLFDSHTDIR